VTAPDALIRPPRQRRSREALERVLRAGSELLQDVGYEGFTVQEVSRRSGVSIGSIYGRTPSKEALILAIHDREMERIGRENERIRAASERAGLSARELIETLVREAAAIMLGNAAVLRVFMHRAVIDEEIWRRGSERSHELARAFERALLDHREVVTHPDPELAIDVAYRLVYSSLARRVTHGSQFESSRAISDDDFVRELARAVADYLLAAA
jgi:AcrR family transcriptional regulator